MLDNSVIEQIKIDDYDKCSNIWNMKKCPFTDEFRKQIKEGNRLVYIYKIDGEFIGEGDLVTGINDIDYFIPGKRIYFSRLIVKKKFRNHGIGSDILDYLIETAKQLGYNEAALGVDIVNSSAIHIYEKKGFRCIAECEDDYGKFYKMLKTF